MSPDAISMVHPLSGQLCFRSLAEGDAMVGLLHFPAHFTPKEGAAYLLVENQIGLTVGTDPLDDGIPIPAYQSDGVGGLLRAPIWKKTTLPSARVVRFIQAFPEENGWTVYGPSHHTPIAGSPSHRWVTIGAQGQMTPLDPPMEANGLAISQILTQSPVWPNLNGELHTLSQLQSPWRAHFHRYHQFLVAARRHPEGTPDLEKVVHQDPIFSQIIIGKLDREYLDYLVAMDDRGELQMDRPRTAAEVAARDTIIHAIVRQQVAREEGVGSLEESAQENCPPSIQEKSSALSRRRHQP